MMSEREEPVPAIHIRAATPSDAASIAAVHITSWRETYAGLMPDAMLNALSVSDRTERWIRILGEDINPADPSVFVAEQEGDVVGFVSGGEQRDQALRAQGATGEITAIYVLRRVQRQRLGSRLMGAAARAFCDRGHQAASLWVLRDNLPARRFYERLGGEVVGEKEDHSEAGTLVELAYFWRDLCNLAVHFEQ